MEGEERVIAGRYRLLELRGQGGMADVYHAVDERLGRDVAVKLLLTPYARDPQFVERFRREAKSAAALNHPNVVAVYDWGADADTYYMVMEYVSGPTLKDVIGTRGPLPEEEALAIAAQAASGLATAHAHDLVHRDIKPHNILLAPDGRAKVADFGIAYAAGATRFTVGNAVTGTAAYMSPEQAQFHGVDPRSDVYSLGIVLYEMLAGAVPYREGSAIEIAMQHVNAAIPDLRAMRPDLHATTLAVLHRALAKDPAGRYPDAASFGAALRTAGEALGPVPPEPANSMATVRMPRRDPHRPAAVAARPPREQGRTGLRAALFAVPLLLAGAIAALVFALTRPSPRTHGGTALNIATSTPSPTTTRKAARAHVPHASPTPSSTPTSPPPTATTGGAPATVPATPVPISTTLPTTAPAPAAAHGRGPPPGTGNNGFTGSSSSGPIQAVLTFYSDVIRQDFTDATTLWTSAMQGQCAPATCIDQEFTANSIANVRAGLVAEHGNQATVAVTLDETGSHGPSHLTGDWYLVRVRGQWLLNGESFCRAAGDSNCGNG